MAAPPLSHLEYNAIPPLEEAINSFHPSRDLMAIGNIFIKHAMNDIWALCVIHRHFDLMANEIMLEQPTKPGANIVTKAVNVNNIATPIVGSSYRLGEDNELQAFEFRYGSDASTQDVEQNNRFQAFLHDFDQVLKERGLHNVVGLTPASSTVRGIETTNYEKRENIVEPYAEELPEGENYIHAVWTFHVDGAGVQRGCVVVKCAITSTGWHQQIPPRHR